MKRLFHKFNSRVAVVALIASVSLSVSACTQVSDNASSESTVGVDQSAERETPSSFSDALVNPGVLTVAIFDDSPPSAFYSSDNRLIGWEVDLVTNIAQRKGVEVKFVGGSFDSVITSVADGKADIGIASMFDTVERQKRVVFVDYFIGGTSWVAKANSEFSATRPCGLRVGAVQDSAQYADYLVRVSSECTREGLEPLTVVGYESIPEAASDVATGRLDAFVADDPVAAYSVSNGYGRIVRTDTAIETQPYGIAVQIGNPEMVDSVQSALQEMAADHIYRNILGRWGVESGSIDQFTINGSPTASTR
jgi:polar amino acid transport system substrate-binding protein